MTWRSEFGLSAGDPFAVGEADVAVKELMMERANRE